MLFAWADDITTQKEIMTLNTKSEIEIFFKSQKNVIFVIDQLNALEKSDSSEANLLYWLTRFTSNHTAAFSFSTNHKDYLDQTLIQTSNNMLHVYDGLTRVCHRKIIP
jgi:Cdc6-like AAA superfamily ATPase